MRWVVALANILLLAAPAMAAELRIQNPSGGKSILYASSHALVIGAAEYEHQSWNDLRRVPDEIKEVVTALEEQGFEVEPVMNPNADTLRTSIRQFITRHGMTDATADNRLLIFFSGHGHTRRNDRGYLVPVDAPDPFEDEHGFLDKALDMKDIMTWAEKIEAKHALFIFDSCFSGTLFQAKALSKPGGAYIQTSTAKPVRQFITAGRGDEEVPAQSIFTPLFIRGLRGEANTNNDAYVTGAELGLFLMQHVPDYPNARTTPQYGKIRDARLEEGDFVFAPQALAGNLQDSEWHEPDVEVFRDCPQCPEMVEIPSGSYQRGSDRREHEAFSLGEELIVREEPQQVVTINYAFAVGRSEVTRSQFKDFVEAAGYKASGCHTRDRARGRWVEDTTLSWQDPGFRQTEDDPVVCMSWDDAEAYTRWLARYTGESYRLLTASEWEYVARAGKTTARYWGDSRDEKDCLYANGADKLTVEFFGLANSPGRIFMCDDRFAFTAPAKSFRSNDFGLYDVIGNVYEWTEDCFVDNYKMVPLDGSAWTGSSCRRRVLRGGSWFSSPTILRAAFRGKQEVQARLPIVGFRVARNLNIKQ